MPNEISAKTIAWQEWSDEAFLAARTNRKPVLLALTASWCHWCHVMDQTSYSDPRVIDLVNASFIPVKVDVDQRPDLSARYNQGGFPSVAFLDEVGKLVAGRVYTPPDEMFQVLEHVKSSYAGSTGKVSITLEAESDKPTPSSGVTAALVRQKMDEIYDSEFGGFGNEPKQPPWEGIEFLLSLYQQNGDQRLREMACRTLDGIATGLLDQRDGGFFRYSVTRDWRVPHYEKMLYTNAQLASVFLLASQVTGRLSYRNTAVAALDYMLTTLTDPISGLFYSSQDAEEEYYRLPWNHRDSAPKVSIDTTFYTGWNALAASVFAKAFGITGAPAYLEKALGIVGKLWSEFEGNAMRMPHEIGTAGGSCLLTDHVNALRASLDCYQVTGDRDLVNQAERLVSSIRMLFSNSDGGHYDANFGTANSGPTLPGVKPVLENALLAEAFISLGTITRKEEYLDEARTTLETFSGVVPCQTYIGPPGLRKVEEDEERLFLPAASAWARASEILESRMVHLVIVGDNTHRATKALVKSAYRSRTLRWTIQVLDPVAESKIVQSLGFPVDASPAAYLCVGSQCLTPIRKPTDLRKWAKSGALASFVANTT